MFSKSLFVSGSLSLLAILTLSGCGSAPYAAGLSSELPMPNDVPGKIFYVEGKEAWRSPSGGYNAKTRNIHILQNTADLTLSEGYRYFSFERPIELSNFDGNMINTAKEFIDKCTPSEGQILDIGNARCGLNGTAMKASVLFVAFKEAPKTILSYDAKEVKAYLQENKLYREDSYEVNEEAVAKLFQKQTKIPQKKQ
ncbi:hypothetical protein SJPD1_0969 [Sulfurospirillum diekertiae]|uniref:Lipoprotein n=1 Tax=Sulfurospirillum diekertiae TaxID=1854492 RepID=A0A290HCY1_9BACT|nr:hypothetical protein [Sulfurospirillum diekertiae]ATB69081.1 hypothetical protein SJPD1_0969 [Sulfurospirillum diekertiae]